MKIAVASQNKNNITEHTGHCRNFWIYQIRDKEIIGKNLLELSPAQSLHNSSAEETHPLDDVQVVISGGMGRGLVRRLEQKGIEAVITKETDLDRAVNAYLDGSLVRVEPECHEDEGQGKHKHQRKHQHQHQHGHKFDSKNAM
jgi:predicted Fe-Mo cluster-binding NifX family protein